MKKQLTTFVMCLLAMVAIMKIPPAAADLSDGLMAYYPFDGTAVDMSGNGNNGTEQGGLTYAMGVKGYAASFDGVDDYIRVPNDDSLNPIDQLTVSFWVKVDEYTNTWSPLVHKGGSTLSGYSNREYTVWLKNTSSFILASAGDNSSQHYQSTCCVGTGWTHYAGIIDRKNHRMQVYIDGILVRDVEDSYSTFNNNDRDLLIGWSEEVFSQYAPFKGRIDELRIYNRVLGEDEITNLYHEGDAIEADLTTGLIAYYPLDGNATDASGNGNDGQVSVPLPCEDRFGNITGAMCFDKEPAHTINIGNRVKPPFPFTISAWIKPDKVDEPYGIISNDSWTCPGHYYGAKLEILYGKIVASYGDAGYCAGINRRNFFSDAIMVAEDWQHVAVVFGSHLNVQLYRNGIAVPVSRIDGTGSSMIYSTANGFIGSMNGALDDVRVYNRILSRRDIEGLYHQTIDSIGNSIQTAPYYYFSLEQNTQTTGSITISNPGDEEQIASLDILNPHSELDISIQAQNPIDINAKSSQTIPIDIKSVDVSTGLYDDILLKISTADGEIIYSNLTVTVTETGEADRPDLSVKAVDIRLADYTLGESVTLDGVIHNNGSLPAENVQVRFYEFGNLLGETVLDEVPAKGAATAAITAPITTTGEHLVRVVVDEDNSIAELNEHDNEASQIIKLGTQPPVPCRLLVTGSMPSSVYTDELFTISGKAVYDVYVNGVRYTNYVVKGGLVQLIVTDDYGSEWIYGNIHTDIDGKFRKIIQAPAVEGSYHIAMRVSDTTLSGVRHLDFSATDRPPVPPTPPAPPVTFGPGTWTSSGDSWTWIPSSGYTPPPYLPHSEADLRVYSKNLHFSPFNPAPGEETTIVAEINYWATSADLVAKDVPVNFYVTYPGTPKMKIGETVIDSLSVGPPDYGSRYVYTSWQDVNEGIHLIEVEIDPSYVEENMRNNAATRALLVGDGQYLPGVVSGQVIDEWGGVENVMIELYTADGSIWEHRLTDATGSYLFTEVPAGDYQVRIIPPDNFRPDTATKDAPVVDGQVTEVDFQLSRMQAPVAEAGGPYTGMAGEVIILDAGASADPDGEIVLYQWDLDNDGLYDLNSTTPVVEHIFTTAVNGEIQLQVTDNDGLTGIDTAEIEVTAPAVTTDLDGDGDVDRSDVYIVLGYRNQPAEACPECDIDGDGVITVLDVRKVIIMCTCPRCVCP